MDKEKSKALDIYNEKSLNLLNIKELRDMGRKFGVPSPTTLKKEELISYILKIVYGEVVATKRNSYGRPTVREFDMDKYLKKIEKNSIVSPENVVYSQTSDFGYLDKVASPSAGYDDSDNIEQRVYVSEQGKCYLRKKGFVKSDDDLEIDSVYANRYALENLDMLEILFVNDDFKILTINGLKVEDKFKGLEIGGIVLKGGSKQVFRLSTKEEINTNILKLQMVSDDIGAKVFVFSKNKYTSSNTTSVVYEKEDNSSNIYKKFMCFLSECEKAVFDCKDIVVVIDQTGEIEKAVNSFELDVQARIKKHLQSEFSKILSLGNVLIVYELDESATY